MIKDRSTLDIYIGQKVLDCRRRRKLTRRRVAELLGISQQQLYKYEQGINHINGYKIVELGRIFEIPCSYFYEDYEKHMEKFRMLYNEVINDICQDMYQNQTNIRI